MNICNMNNSEQIKHLEECLVDPKWRCHPDFLNKLIADDFEECNPNHGFEHTVNKQEALHWLAQPEEHVSWTITQFTVKMASDDLAIARYLSQKTKSVDNITITKHYTRLSIWRKRQLDPDIPWELLFHQSLSLDA